MLLEFLAKKRKKSGGGERSQAVIYKTEMAKKKKHFSSAIKTSNILYFQTNFIPDSMTSCIQKSLKSPRQEH